MAFLRTVSRRCAGKKLNKYLMALPPGFLESVARPSVHMMQLCVKGCASSSTSGSEVKPVLRQIDPLDLRFNDPIAAFKSKTMTELIRAYLVYQICSIDYMVENNSKVSFLEVFYYSGFERARGEVTLKKMSGSLFTIFQCMINYLFTLKRFLSRVIRIFIY